MGKKKNRLINIAHKRAKRQQRQKSKRRLLAFKKQQQLQHAKSDEERLQEKILKSKLLLDEPEFENITFNQSLLLQKLLELAASSQSSSINEGDVNSFTEEALAEADEKFRSEALPDLITPEFVSAVSQSLKACETRLKRMGYREKAETAFVARSLFELADPHMLAFHPLVLKICLRTLEQLLAQPSIQTEAMGIVYDVLRDLKEQAQLAEEDDADALDDDKVAENTADVQNESHQTTQQTSEAATDVTPIALIAPENLPAKALYKNFDGLEISDVIEVGDGYRVVEHTTEAVELVHTDFQRHIRLTEDRLLLRCAEKSDLDIAMKEIEKLCGESLFYLARTVDRHVQQSAEEQ
jgi:hypothetical protein